MCLNCICVLLLHSLLSKRPCGLLGFPVICQCQQEMPVWRKSHLPRKSKHQQDYIKLKLTKHGIISQGVVAEPARSCLQSLSNCWHALQILWFMQILFSCQYCLMIVKFTQYVQTVTLSLWTKTFLGKSVIHLCVEAEKMQVTRSWQQQFVTSGSLHFYLNCFLCEVTIAGCFVASWMISNIMTIKGKYLNLPTALLFQTFLPFCVVLTWNIWSYFTIKCI